MLSLKNCEVGPTGAISAFYSATLADGKSAPVEVGVVRLESDADGARAAVDLAPLSAGGEEDAFDALAEKLELLAKAIRARGEAARGVPVYG